MKNLLIGVLTLISNCVLIAQKDQQFNRHIFIQEMDEIITDGDLSDWPKDIDKYPIEEIIWSDGSENLGFKASFQAGYNMSENALYLAIIVVDDTSSTLQGKSFDVVDSYSLFIDEQYHINGSGIARYSVTENSIDVDENTRGWDLKLDHYLNESKLTYEVNSKKGQKIYELKFTLNEPIFYGRVIGLGHMVIDIDGNSENIYGFVGRGGKNDTAQQGRIGTVTFLENKDDIAKVTGAVKWANDTITTKPEGLRFISKTNKKSWYYQKLSDDNGNYSTSLPYGEYYILPGKASFFNDYNYHKANEEFNKTYIVKNEKQCHLGTYNIEEVTKPYFTYPGDIVINRSKSNINQLNKSIQEYMDYYSVEGASLLVLKDHKIVYKQHFGYANNYSQLPVNDQTLFEVASITKPFFSFAVMRLYERGLIDLDKPLYNYLEFEQVADHPFSKLLTAKHILAHQSGLPNWPTADGYTFLSKPGEGYFYSGSAYQYLAKVIEKITGKNINQVLHEEISKPLGIKNLYFQAHEDVLKHKSHGHFNGYPGFIDMPDRPWVAGCLITNTESLAEFLFAIDQRKGLKPETYEIMLNHHTVIPDNQVENIWGFKEFMSLGFFVEKYDDTGTAIGHTGNNGDFKSVFKYYEEDQVGYVLLTNGNTGQFLETYIEKFLRDPKKI